MEHNTVHIGDVPDFTLPEVDFLQDPQEILNANNSPQALSIAPPPMSTSSAPEPQTPSETLNTTISAGHLVPEVTISTKAHAFKIEPPVDTRKLLHDRLKKRV